MENLNLKTITINIFKLLDYSGITDLDFADLLDISEKQLRLIKKGKAEFSIDNINKACNFFNITLSKINKTEVQVDNDFRETLALKHKNNSEFYPLVESRPTIRHAIRFTLLPDNTFNSKGLGVGDIKTLFDSKGWDFTSTYISTSMIRNSNLVKVVGSQIVKGKKANLYGPK